MFSELEKEFHKKGIPTEKPDFYDHPNFIKEEQRDPSYLIKFAKFVAEKPYSDEYLKKAEVIISDVAKILSEQLLDNGRQGACVDISGILARILERKGIWCACIKGSCTIEFPIKSNEETTYYWSADQGEFTAGHAWVFAPPFSIVDITLKQQPYTGNKKSYIPEIIMVKDAVKTTSTIEDIISPEVRMLMKAQGMPKHLMLQYGASEMKLIQEIFPAQLVELNGTTFKFSPVAAHASIESLPGIKNMKFNGMYPYDMFKKYIKDKVPNIA
ncbi:MULTISPECIES: hypothetical protein [unclassified Halomonas]|uniref:hypothetical protein n=1 Tax=unclassified Halomonas TaxID=2609666 RepID=UPI0009904958|nr:MULTISPECIES: hypothetical protein [unclassified Halomonas]AQU81514.1 hypothetical protein B2G49_02175 [Halomonas sp. 'Soap Lake \